jgi:hypothetical protein
VAKRKPKTPAGSAVAADLTIPVKYGDLSVGDGTCRIGLTAFRDKLTLKIADEKLCGKRLIGCISCAPGNNNPEQSPMPGMDADVEIAAAFDVKRVNFTIKTITFGLTFAIASLKVEDLVGFAKRAGKLVVTQIQDIPKNEATGTAEDEGEEE